MKNTALNVLLTLYLISAAGAYLIGARPLIVASNSMAPAMNKGDLVIIIKNDHYEVEDIISFKKKGGVATHRIITINDQGYKTKGDANQLDDFGSIKNDNILGKVELIIPSFGFLLMYLQSKYFAYLFLILLAYLLFKNVKK